MAKKKRSWIYNFLLVISIAIGLAFIIVTLGVFIKKENEKNKLAKKENKIIEPFPEKEIKNNSKEESDEEIHEQVKICDQKIAKLNSQLNQIEKRENRIFFVTRILISSLILSSNIIYLWIEQNWCWDLADMLNFNGAIVISYTFVAFIGYSTPDRFIMKMKLIVSNYIRNRNLSLQLRLKSFVEKKKNLENRLSKR